MVWGYGSVGILWIALAVAHHLTSGIDSVLAWGGYLIGVCWLVMWAVLARRQQRQSTRAKRSGPDRR